MELTKAKKQLVESLFKDDNRITDRVHRHRLKKDELSKNKVNRLLSENGFKKVANSIYFSPVSLREMDVLEAVRECMGRISGTDFYIKHRFMNQKLSEDKIHEVLLKYGYNLVFEEQWIKFDA